MTLRAFRAFYLLALLIGIIQLQSTQSADSEVSPNDALSLGRAKRQSQRDLEPPNKLKVDAITKNRFRVRWTLPRQRMTGTHVTIQEVDGDYFLEATTSRPRTRHVIVNELQPGTTYRISLSAVNNGRNSNVVTTTVTTKGIKKPVNPVSRVLLEAGTHGRPGHVHDPGFDVTSNSGSTTHTTTGGGSSGRMVVTHQGGSSSSSGSTGEGSSRRVVVTSGGSTSAGGLDGFDNAGGGSSRVVITHHGGSSSSSTGGGGNFTRRVVVTHGSSSSTGGGGNFTRRVVVTHGGSSSSSRGLDGRFVTSQEGSSSSRVVSGGSSSSSSSSSSSGQSSSQGGGSSINGGRSRVVITSQGGSSSRVVSGGGSSSSSSSGGSSSGSSSSSSQGGRLSAGGVGPGGEFEFRPEQPRRSGTIERCKRAQKTDLVILTDGSWSVGPRNFEKMQNFLVGLIDSFTIGFDGVLVGIAQYSDNARTEFNLNDHVTQESLAEAIRNIPYLGGNTATGQALDYIREKLFTTADGARPGVSKTAIIITDGESILDSVTEPARRLREANVTVFSIGVGAALKSELIDIASKPSTSHVFSVNKFDDIEGIKDSLLRDVCQSIAVCRSLVTPENGRQACDKNMTVQGTKCEFICDQPRYKLEEGGLTVVRTCLDTGRWDNPEPFCIAALCDQLEPPPDGRYECTDNNRVGSVCTLRCSVGYRPFGSITTRCQDSARWSSRNAGCELITCPVAIAPVHGTVSCTLDNEYSSICTFTCDQGYEMQGEESSSCTATTRWSVAFPTCYIITCPALNDLEHGSVDCSDNRNYASRCEFDCTAGYQLIGSQFATCGGVGSWAFARRGVFPVCERIRCNEQELGPHLQVTCTDGLYYNSECSYTCDEGFELQGPETSRCRGRVSPGRWSEIVPVCNQITCPALQSIPNSQIVCNNGRNYGSRCSLRCNEGFQLSADSLTTCGGQGLWAGALALCIRITCDELGGIANGELTCNDGVNYGSECTYTCEVGYRLVTGSRIRRCQSDGQFDGVAAQCAITQCLTLVAPLNGRVECTRGNDFGSQCRYTCKAGYELDVEFSANGVQRRCREDLQWSHEQPKCRLISCGILVPPVDGSVRCSDHDRYGSICQFACNVGYEMSGSAERLCQDTRVWTGVLTTCRLIQCEALPALEHGSMVCTNDNNAGDEFAEEVPNAFGTSCSFSCNEGYFLSGARVSNCQADRRWSGGAIVCFRITCPFLSAPLHSVIECTQDNEYDSVCTVTCNTGYFLASGNRDRTCQGNYIWSGKEAVCQIMTCDGLVARAHSTMTCTNGNRFGSICTFKPELGYELLGEAVIVCDETGGDEPPIARRMTCQSLEAPENGVIACSDEAFFDSTCSFTCDEGYELVGSVKRDCLLSRSWSGVAVSCKLITCPVLIAPAFGSVKCSSGNLYESECMFSCDEGYDLEGSFSRSCQGSRLWTGVEVTCVLITCPELAAPPNGVVECSKGWDFSSSCNFECNEGYLLSGRSTRNCRADHRWSGIDVTCILITCSVLPSPGQGRKLCTDESNFASECRFICNVGYNLVGSEQRTCQESGEWSGLRTSCGIKTCLNLKAPQNGKKTCSDGENYESNCRFSCNLGYELVGSNSRSCEESAEWSGTVTTCRQITCPELTAPSDGTVTCEGNAFTSECEFTCNVGFLMVGSSLRTCQLDKQWSGIETRCERIVCPELRVPENGKVTCLDGSNYGSDCVFQCNEGFELLGTSTRTCQLNHAWSGIEVVCQLIVCGSLPDVPNGGMTCTNNNVFGSECTFACNEGFTLTGDETRTCMQTRFWSGVQVICSMILCETLKAPRNGRKTCTNGDNYDSDCTFSCADGYEMSGTRVRTCLADNSWTGKEARCHLITCPVLPAPENGAKQCVAGSDFDSICRFTCNVGYELKASRSRRCTEDGTWTGRDTKCRLIRCGDLPAPLNGQISCTNEDAYASECTFTCANGYELVGASSRVCLDSEAWSKSQPSCQVIRCGALTAPKNGIMLCSNEDKYNSRCDYGCNVGFELVGADFSRCRLDKTWTVDPAICKAIVCDEIVIPNARVECTNGYEYNSRCVFIPDEGYEFDVDDDNSFTCLANRKQDDGPQELRDSPTIMSCDVLRGPENGVIRCPTGVVFRSECTFRCDAGYQLVGSTKTTCLSVDSENRELGIDWTERVPRCSLIECEVIEAPSNGRMTCTSGFLQGSRCAIECNAGFELVGASNRICQENRDWDRPKPLCLGITCGALDEPDHGSFTCSEGDSYNSVCQFSCDQGYRLTGSITRTCLGSRTWSGALASCIVIRCGPLEGPEHGSVTCNNADFYGSECSLSCNAGFTLVGTRSRECSGLGAWSSVQAQCTLIACPRLFPPANGVVTCSNSFNFNSICRITCDDGYELVGSSTRVCGTDGNFSGAEGRCRQISCADLDEIDDGSLRCVDGFKYNSVCTYFCDRGYDLIGTPNRKCLSSGEWSNTEPICERVVCTELSAPQHGTIKCSDSNLSGSTCTASCGECFLSAGAVSRRCRANARWSGEPFACEASYCQPLHAPSNGEIECGEDDLYRCGSQCTVKCNPGFRLEGDASRTCGSDRRWEGTKARCIKSNCDVLRLDDGVTASCTKENQIGSNCSFTCAEGTLLGSKFRVCQDNGRWSNSNPICKACKTAVSDVLFIIDGSWSVGEANFAKVKTFLKDLVEPFQVGWDNSRFGVIQYSDDPRVEFYMNQFFTAEDVRNGIDAIPYKGGNTHTGHALSFALLSAMTPANGARPYVNKVALILTDGRSQDEVGNPARKLRQAGVKLIAVGVGNDADVNELRQIASPPYESSVFKSDDFDSIGDIQAALSAKLCESKLPPGDLCGCPAGPPGPPGPSGPAGRPGAAAKGEKGDAFSVVHVNYKDQTITARNGDGSVVDVNLPDNLRTGRDARGRNFFSMPGPPGAPGPSGTPGKDGRPGPQGAAGPPGPEGPRGDRGPRGHDGNDGIDGLNGQPGTPGKAARPAPPSGISSNEKKRMMAQLEGTARRYAEMEVRRVIERNDVVTRDTRSPPKLVVGPPGPPGPRGPQGYEGAQGVAGQQGVQGPTGKTGAKGSMGDKGARGIPGVGQRGPAGPRGRPGKKGQSKRGLPGQRGPRGPPGPPGRVVYRKRGKKIQ